MPRSRSRSRSPGSRRNRDRRRSRSRERRHRKKRSRSRSPRHKDTRSPPRRRISRSPSPPRRRSLSKEREPQYIDDRGGAADQPIIIDDPQPDADGPDDDEQVDMMKLMGFSTFDTTKGKKVEGNDVSSVNIQRKRRYRQYMNRKGGFNRPLDFIA